MTRILIALSLMIGLCIPAAAQEAQVAFGGLRQDTTLPVEIEADSLTVNNADGTAIFTGNVLVGQGEMRLQAATIRVEYGTDGKSINRLLASGGVTLTNAAEAAEAREAVYTVSSGEVVMTGDVLLTQGQTALSGQKLVISLKDGTGVMEGRVSSTFIPGEN
jgi:lipopolysaccharide export system protein LptA